MTKKEVKIPRPKKIKQQVDKIANIKEFVNVANTELAEMLYISVDEKKGERSYRGEFKLLDKDGLQRLIKDKIIKVPETYKAYKCFVYNEHEEKVLPFKENNHLTHEHGHFTFDGKDCISHDNNGDELFKFPFKEICKN